MDPPLPIPNRVVKRGRADDSVFSHAKVGHCQAPYKPKSPARESRGFFMRSRTKISKIRPSSFLWDFGTKREIIMKSLWFLSLRFLFLIILTLTVSCIAGRLGAQLGNKPYRAVMDTDGVQQINILAGDYFFKPNHIIVKVNVPVRLVVRVERGIVPHGLVLKALEANISIDEDLSREFQTFIFTPSAPGRYAFYCPKKLLFFKSHREHGMEGILEVVE